MNRHPHNNTTSKHDVTVAAAINPFEKGYTRIAGLNLGCKTNRYETDAVLADFESRGYDIVSFQDEADIYIINTCSVTGEAGRKSGQMVRRARKKNPQAIVVAMGCHVELGAESLGADIIVGNIGKTKLPSLISTWLAKNPDPQTRERLNYRAFAGSLNADKTPHFEEFGPQVIQSESRGIIKIQDGCNHFCTYCAIPLARGRVRSRKPELIIQEVENLAARGFREMVLTGIHICSYGQDFGEADAAAAAASAASHTDASIDDTEGRQSDASTEAAATEPRGDGLDLIRLLEQMAAVPGVERIRLGSVEPKSVTPEFARRLGRIAAICPHVHLSLQSGSDAVLRRMNRKYSTAEYRDAVRALREHLPGLNLTTDLIVGFPGETEAEHRESLDFCAEMGFGRIHVFRYSAREGTAAAKFKGQVAPEIVTRRSAEMHDLAAKLMLERQRSILGQEAEMLLESRDKDGNWIGYTAAYDMVGVCFAEGEKKDIGREGDIWRVRLIEDSGDEIVAEAIECLSKGWIDS